MRTRVFVNIIRLEPSFVHDHSLYTCITFLVILSIEGVALMLV